MFVLCVVERGTSWSGVEQLSGARAAEALFFPTVGRALRFGY